METLAEFNAKGVSDEEIAAAYAQIENSIVGAMESVQGRSSLLMFFHYIHNGKSYNLPEELARYKKSNKRRCNARV
jgi:hypothetical protein